jgi:hypothetical protein
MLSYSNILYLVATFWVDMHFVFAEPITCATILRSEVPVYFNFIYGNCNIFTMFHELLFSVGSMRECEKKKELQLSENSWCTNIF